MTEKEHICWNCGKTLESKYWPDDDFEFYFCQECREKVVDTDFEENIWWDEMDLAGLLADRANDIPLNKLMERNCSECDIPRNQTSNK